MTSPSFPAGPAEELRELCRLRSTLETFAVRALRHNPGRETVFAALREHAARLHAAAGRGVHRNFHEEDIAFHRSMVAACGQPELLQCWEIVSARLDAWIFHVKLAHWPSLMALYREHVFLLDAWEGADLSFAEQATHHHLEAGWYRVTVSQGELPGEGDAVDRTASFLSTHFADSIDIAWVAKNVGFVSSSHLTRLFRRHFGLAPYAWLRQVRMDRAREFLTSGTRSVADVARGVGYQNVSHFIRDFRVRFGITPKKYISSHVASAESGG